MKTNLCNSFLRFWRLKRKAASKLVPNIHSGVKEDY